jgi:hypothetical protein
MQPHEFVSLLTDFGVIGLLAFIIFAGMKKWWVWGWQYRDLQKKCDQDVDFWKAIALRALNVSETAVSQKSYDN